MYAFDAKTGDSVWDITGAYRPFVFADGYIATVNMTTCKSTPSGKGSTQTTVTAPDIWVTVGSSVLIQGKVIDTSAEQIKTGPATRFPDGVPAIADENMTDWKE
jgi:hypothetical protein